MLTVTPEYFLSHDVAEIKNWLTLPGAVLFRKALMNEISKEQIEASVEAIKAIEPGKARFEGDAAVKLRRVRDLQQVVKELDKAGGAKYEPFTAKILSK